MIIRTYHQLASFEIFEERFEYLKLGGVVGKSTFGFDRVFNQQFYCSKEWKDVRRQVILRDNGCDLGIPGFEIFDPRSIIIHHINPISLDDIKNTTEILLNPEYLITTTHRTHNAIHYGDANLLPKEPIVRTKNDTCPWKK